MIPWIIISILLVLILVAIAAYFLGKEQRKEIKRTGKYPEGHFIGMGIALGIPIGIPIGIAMGNIALGYGMGLPIGLAIGVAMEKKNKDKIRPLTDKEKKAKRIATIGAIITLVLGIIVFLGMIFFLK